MILFTGISFLLRWNPGDEIIYLIELTIDYLFSQMWIMDTRVRQSRSYVLTGISFSPRSNPGWNKMRHILDYWDDTVHRHFDITKIKSRWRRYFVTFWVCYSLADCEFWIHEVRQSWSTYENAFTSISLLPRWNPGWNKLRFVVYYWDGTVHRHFDLPKMKSRWERFYVILVFIRRVNQYNLIQVFVISIQLSLSLVISKP